jgi:hypothetical protein
MKQTFGKTKTMSKDDELAAKTRRQVDNAVSWLEKRYFTDEVRAKNQHLLSLQKISTVTQSSSTTGMMDINT